MGRYDHNIRLFINNETYADMLEVKSLITRYTGDQITNAWMIHATMALMKELDKQGKLKQYIKDIQDSSNRPKMDWH